MFKKIKLLVVFASLVVIVFGSWFLYSKFSSKKEDAKFEVKVSIDKVVIINKVQNLSRLETVKETIQRDVEIELNLGDFKIFDYKLGENKRTQKFAVTGTVTAGINLSDFTEENLKLDGKNLTINLPKPEILNVNIIEDKTTLLKDNLSVLFKTRDIFDESRRRELNDELYKQAIKQSKEALVSGACDNRILDTANKNATTAVSDLFKQMNYDSLKINTNEPEGCSLSL